jgi:hypothetical protein
MSIKANESLELCQSIPGVDSFVAQTEQAMWKHVMVNQPSTCLFLLQREVSKGRSAFRRNSVQSGRSKKLGWSRPRVIDFNFTFGAGGRSLDSCLPLFRYRRSGLSGSKADKALCFRTISNDASFHSEVHQWETATNLRLTCRGSGAWFDEGGAGSGGCCGERGSSSGAATARQVAAIRPGPAMGSPFVPQTTSNPHFSICNNRNILSVGNTFDRVIGALRPGC